MEFFKAKRIVIITESLILDDVIKVMTGMGVTGYTVQVASGKGERGIRSGDEISGLFKNVRIEALTNQEAAKKIAVEVVERFFKDYAGVVFLDDVEVIQEKLLGLRG